jgi:hypothetical protein
MADRARWTAEARRYQLNTNDLWESAMRPGQTKIFIKSGNEVRLVERSGKQDWLVERTKGRSQGKRMICPERALVDSLSIGNRNREVSGWPRVN